MKKIISTSAAPAAIGPYSQGMRVGNFIYSSGQIPIDPLTGAFAGEDIETQTKQSLENVKSILASEDYGMSDVIKTTVFLSDMNDFAAMNAIYATYFVEPYPARSTIQVAKLPKNALIEIEVVAYKED